MTGARVNTGEAYGKTWDKTEKDTASMNESDDKKRERLSYNRMSVAALRSLVRERGLAKGAAVVSASKADLIALLMGEAQTLGEGSTHTTEAVRTVVPDADVLPQRNTDKNLADALAAVLEGKLKAGVDEDKVKEIVEGMDLGGVSENMDALRADVLKMIADISAPTVVDIRKTDGTVTRMDGVQHNKFPLLLAFAQSRDKDGRVPPVYMHGPAGTGKTTAAHNVAKALGLEFYFNGAIDSEYKLSGFIDAGGVFRSRPFCEAYTYGGVYLFDELDSSLPSAVLAFNAALANGHADFPIGRVDRHKDCIILAAGNTSLRGDGGTSGYQRMEQDTAFRDRFVFIEWLIDEGLEKACVHADHHKWLDTVRKVRANVVKHGIKKADITPRATFGGVALLTNDVSWDDVVNATLRKGIPDDQWAKMSEGI